LARRLELPCTTQDIDTLSGAVKGCGIVEALEASSDCADGVESGECRVSRKEVGVHAVEHDAVEDLEDEIHGCDVLRSTRRLDVPDWRGGRAELRQERELRSSEEELSMQGS
jgi:hypothetical protein